jgi:hypothetical protein
MLLEIAIELAKLQVIEGQGPPTSNRWVLSPDLLPHQVHGPNGEGAITSPTSCQPSLWIHASFVLAAGSTTSPPDRTGVRHLQEQHNLLP